MLQSGDETMDEARQRVNSDLEDASPVWVRPTGLKGWWCVDHPHPRQQLFVPPPPRHGGPGPGSLKTLSLRRWTYYRKFNGEDAPRGPEEIDIGSRTQEKKLPFWGVGITYICEVGVEDENENDE